MGPWARQGRSASPARFPRPMSNPGLTEWPSPDLRSRLELPVRQRPRTLRRPRMQGPPTATLIGAMTTAGGSISAADTSWMLVATALVLLMTPALAFFYGGLVRSKNALNTMMMSFISLGFVGVLWAVIGYSLAFAPGNAWVGDTSRIFLRGVGLEAQGTIPHMLFMS